MPPLPFLSFFLGFRRVSSIPGGECPSAAGPPEVYYTVYFPVFSLSAVTFRELAAGQVFVARRTGQSDCINFSSRFRELAAGQVHVGS